MVFVSYMVSEFSISISEGSIHYFTEFVNPNEKMGCDSFLVQ